VNDRLNLLFVFADQWRAQAFGYTGDTNVSTPNADRFAGECVNFTNAVSGCPVCSPYRASLMTGVYPHRHRMTVNDQCLHELYRGPFLASCLAEAGYRTAYIGKWHLDGHGRNSFVPPERRLGFDFWRGFECTHAYQDSYYYADDDPRPHPWRGYDAEAQTDEACRYLRDADAGSPFALFLSWGPPHSPFGSAPEQFEKMYDPARVSLAPNVPEEHAARARKDLAGYYAHCSALDACLGRLLQALDESGLAGRTIVVFTSDHGDMLGSQGTTKKQKPWAESIRVPLLLRDPRAPMRRTDDAPLDAPDLMPTLLGLCGVEVPAACQGRDVSRAILEGSDAPLDEALLALYVPFHEWSYDRGGREFRGLHDRRHTYVRALRDGPWLLYDNREDPLQLRNLAGEPGSARLVEEYDRRLSARLDALGDEFLEGGEYLRRDNVALDANGDVLVRKGGLPEPYPD
jgi:arylsulfatase A-like enzyme